VQQCSTVVVFHPHAAVQKLRGFAQWLPRHAALVKSITAAAGVVPRQSSNNVVICGQPWDDQFDELCLLLQQAMQAAAAAETGTSTAAAAPAAVDLPGSSGKGSGQQQQQQVQLQQQQHIWRLGSFSGSLPGALGILPVLPAHSLTSLVLNWKPPFPHYTDLPLAELSQLTRLSNLQSVSLISKDFHCRRCWLPEGCLRGLEQLTHLTHLALSGHFKGDIQAQLHQLLTHTLPLQRLHLDFTSLDDDVLPSLRLPDLRHLTRLEEFVTRNNTVEAIALPTQLRSAGFAPSSGSEVLLVVMPLQSLARLHLSYVRIEPHDLLALRCQILMHWF
jgi:hypothetical protein